MENYKYIMMRKMVDSFLDELRTLFIYQFVRQALNDNIEGCTGLSSNRVENEIKRKLC